MFLYGQLEHGLSHIKFQQSTGIYPNTLKKESFPGSDYTITTQQQQLYQQLSPSLAPWQAGLDLTARFLSFFYTMGIHYYGCNLQDTQSIAGVKSILDVLLLAYIPFPTMVMFTLYESLFLHTQ